MALVERIDVVARYRLDDYAAIAPLAASVAELRAEAAMLAPRLAGRRVWMLNSTDKGGGVAEMMPRVVALLRELGVATEWIVMRPVEPAFFVLTKRLHNLLHGDGAPELGGGDRALYERVSQACAAELAPRLEGRDVLVVHDPQPLGIGAHLRRTLAVPLVWRCHVGTDEDNAATRAAWAFLAPWAIACDHAVFSSHEYIRDFLAGRASIMHPTIDPLSHKNRELHPTKLVGILANAGLLVPTHPVLAPPFAAPALRLRPDGSFAPASDAGEVGMPYRPLVCQVSRWDRLKGFAPLLEAFATLKRKRPHADVARARRRLDIVRLVLAGPQPGAVADDPEAGAVLADLVARYRALPPAVQADVALLALPMSSTKENALMVNCLQRCAAVVVQNSLREGFGLTATEAMWKSVPVLASRASGLRLQIRDGLDGRTVADPTDAGALADALGGMLADEKRRLAWGRSGQRRVFDEFLIFTQLRAWLRVLARCACP